MLNHKMSIYQQSSDPQKTSQVVAGKKQRRVDINIKRATGNRNTILEKYANLEIEMGGLIPNDAVESLILMAVT